MSTDSKLYQYDIFMSYSHEDKDIVFDLVNKMKQHGIKIWIDDEQISVGDRYPEKIEIGLLESRYIVICLSKSYRNSEWCMSEYQSVLAKRMKSNSATLLPVVVNEFAEEDIPSLLSDRHHVDIRKERGVEELIKKVKAHSTKGICPVIEAQKDLICLKSKNLVGDNILIAYDNFGVRLISLLKTQKTNSGPISELVFSYKESIESILKVEENSEYRRLFCQRMTIINSATAKVSKQNNEDDEFNYYNFIETGDVSPYSFGLMGVSTVDVIKKILSSDELERDEGVDQLLRDGPTCMIEKINSITDIKQKNRILEVLWFISPRILLYYNNTFNELLKYLVSFDSNKWKLKCDLLKQIMAPNVNHDKLFDYLCTIPEIYRVVYEKYLVLSQNANCRLYAIKKLKIEDRWDFFLSERVSLSTIKEIFEISINDCSDSYLKAVFLFMKARLLTANTPIGLKDTYEMIKCFYRHSLFMQETFFKELTNLHNKLSLISKDVFVSDMFENEINDYFKSFISKGMAKDVNHGEMSHIPLTIQRHLSRKGYFIELFCCHSRDVIAVETVPHIERREDAHTIIRLPRINPRVLDKVASNKLLMQRYINRVTFCSHPKAQAELVRNYIPSLNRQDIKNLSFNKYASNYARDLASKYSTRYA